MSTSWRDNLKPASFRGVPFGVFATSVSGGRRIANHEYPGRDVPFVEDLGRLGRAYNIEAFVVGSDYMQRRDALIEALEAKGPGKLVHPYAGELTLQVEGYAFDETRDDGGMAAFHITLRQSEKITYPSTAVNQSAAVVSDAGALQDAIAQATAYAYSVRNSENQGLNYDVANAATQTVYGTATVVKKRMQPDIVALLGTLDQFTKDIARLSADATQLITTPAALSYRFISLISRLAVVADPIRALTVYQRLFDDINGYFVTKTYTANSAQKAANDAALKQTLQVGVISSAAQAAASATYESWQQANAARNTIDNMIEGVIYSITDDSVYESITSLRTSIAQAIPPEGTTLKDLVTVSVPASVPSLALAWRIYAAVDSELDIVSRNDIRNPFCVPGGSTVQVLR